MKDSDLIKRGDVERWILTESACIDTPADRDDVVDRMRYSIPAVDAVEVVRCKDCKYCHIEDEYEAWCYGGLPAVLTRASEDFCSHGQRREDGDGDG